MVEEAKALAAFTNMTLISSFSESDSDQASSKRQSQPAVQQAPLATSIPPATRPKPIDSDSDSVSEVETERTRKLKPVSRASPRTKSAASDSDNEVVSTPVVEKVISVVPGKVLEKVTKPGRGRPRKNQIVPAEEKEKEVKKRGRKPKPKIVAGDSDGEVKEVGKL